MKRNLLFVAMAALFSLRGFSQGFYMEFKITTNQGGTGGSMKSYAQDGNSRSEVSIAMGGSSSQAMNNSVVVLSLKSDPKTAYMLDESKKTYNELDISGNDDMKDYDQADYEITVLGKEKVNGYNATHVKVTNKKSDFEEEMWTTTELADYADFEKLKTKYTGKENLNKALAAKGAGGFPVRIVMNRAMGIRAQLDLVKAEKRNNPASMFSLEGYKKLSDGAGGSDVQQLMQKMQNMTPEEKQQFIDQMKQQYGGGAH